MKSIRSFQALPLAVLVASAFLASGCSTTPPAAERMISAPNGTVTTYHRKSSGSLGAFDGPVVWTQNPGTWQGKAVMAVASPQGGTTLHDPVTHAMVATLTPAGQPAYSFNPPVGYQWPMAVGNQWTSRHAMTVHATGATLPMEMKWSVEAWEDITVPAGKFKAYKVVSVNNFGEVETRWVSPKDGLGTVRRQVVRPASHPQGAGQLEGVLLSVKRPAG